VTPAQRQAVANERAKLFAQALDRASTGCFVVGVFGPLAGASWANESGLAWIGGALALHIVAQMVLGRIR
jgi:hypothetical protein